MNQISVRGRFEGESGTEVDVLLRRQEGTEMIEMCYRQLSCQQSPAFSDQFDLKVLGSGLPCTFNSELVCHVFRDVFKGGNFL